jgi:hypothetical protein
MFCSIYLLLSIEYLNTNFCTAVCVLWSWVSCCLCSEYSFPLQTWLKIVDGKLWLSFEYKSCSLFNLDVSRIFVWYHCYCGIKVMKMRSNERCCCLLAWIVFAGRQVGAYDRCACWLFHVYGCFGAKNCLWSGGAPSDRA